MKLPSGRGGDLLTGIRRDTIINSNRLTSLFILIGSGDLYAVLQDSCRGILQVAQHGVFLYKITSWVFHSFYIITLLSVDGWTFFIVEMYENNKHV